MFMRVAIDKLRGLLYHINMNRLDKELVERGIVKTRSKAQELIKNGNVKCDGNVILKSSFEVDDLATIELTSTDTLRYVSRAGLKLEKALQVFNIDLTGKTVMDIGSSTGGFTDCALQHGASKVIAVDVGTNVMDEGLRRDPRIELHEQTNIKDLPSECFKSIDFVVVDVSFISLSKIFEKLSSEKIKVDIIALIKPQFECGKKIADKFRGVVTDRKIHSQVIENVILSANSFGWYIQNLDISPIKGGDGNVEYISLFSNKAKSNKNLDIARITIKKEHLV